ncbi:hypothetical protein Syun_002919 [Stephania yunnanensis]|uniref:Transmembrane 9 superfamily member n=1 Tax=Stephania yunnanensis TaxID=152371 RepID=A0AAP0L1X5_9MAGN
MVVVFIIWAFISFPLALLGTVVGRNWSGAPNNPCRVKTIPRPIPEKKWYLTPSIVSLMGGLLPFGSIFIEMYFVFTSFGTTRSGRLPGLDLVCEEDLQKHKMRLRQGSRLGPRNSPSAFLCELYINQDEHLEKKNSRWALEREKHEDVVLHLLYVGRGHLEP